jgi:hypothetical protein
MPPLRKRPDLDETREALRRHDRDMADEHESDEAPPADDDDRDGNDDGAG